MPGDGRASRAASLPVGAAALPAPDPGGAGCALCLGAPVALRTSSLPPLVAAGPGRPPRRLVLGGPRGPERERRLTEAATAARTRARPGPGAGRRLGVWSLPPPPSVACFLGRGGTSSSHSSSLLLTPLHSSSSACARPLDGAARSAFGVRAPAASSGTHLPRQRRLGLWPGALSWPCHPVPRAPEALRLRGTCCVTRSPAPACPRPVP